MLNKDNMKILGLIAAVVVVLSIFLPWIVMSGSVLGVTSEEEVSGADIYNEGDSDYRYYPLYAAFAAVAFIILTLMDLKGRIGIIAEVAMGIAVLASCYLTFGAFSEFQSDYGWVSTDMSIGYGMAVAMIGGLVMIVAAYLNNE